MNRIVTSKTRAAILESEAGMAPDTALGAAVAWWIDRQCAKP